MLSSLLSVLLMGMLPVAFQPSVDEIALHNLTVTAPLPLTASSSTILTLPKRVTASGMIITDLQSGQQIFAREGEKRRPMGSLTKLMTALIIVENHSMKEIVKVPSGIEKTTGHVLHFSPGERFTVGDLLTAMLVASANDAARTLAQFHAGSNEAFVLQMNERANALGIRDTSYATPDGMDARAQWSTPRDLAWLASFVLRKKEIRMRMSTPEATIHSLGGRTLTIEHTHELMREPGPVIAGKTGTTDAAGQCLLSIVKEGRREYVVVLLDSIRRYADMRVVLSALASLFV